MSIVKYRPPNSPYHIAILGRSGVGKSSLCNSLRDRHGEELDAAAVGIIETTTKPTCYEWMENVFLWDVPGVSTPTISKDDYCQLIDINRYDMFLILSRNRFTEIDLWLAELIQERFGKTRFFIRTGIDEELRNYRRDYPKNFQIDNVLQIIRQNCSTNLQTIEKKTNLSLYLLNTKDKTKYDFPQLIDDIIHHVRHEYENPTLTVIKDDTPPIQRSAALQTAQTIVKTWARFGLLPYLYDRYYK